MSSKTAYLVDFDGTITTNDLSCELAAHFGGSAYMQIENSYRRRDIPIQVWLQQIVKLLPPDLAVLEAKSLEWAVIRPGFEMFLEHARMFDRPVFIASDGFGFYIEPILKRAELLEQISFIYRNETFLDENGNLGVRNPHAHKVCPVCGNCKAAHVVRLKEEGWSIIYVGDGSNDRFGASWGDLICARDMLAESCRENGLAYSQWIDFYDIIRMKSPQKADRSSGSLCCPVGSGVKR